jgi:enoyl-CoA hydratase/carnithine racemase
MLAHLLDRALKQAGLPIAGVTIGRHDNRSTWRVQFAGTPTKADIAKAQALIDRFDEADERKAAHNEEAAAKFAADPVAVATVAACAEAMGILPADFHDAVLAKLRGDT